MENRELLMGLQKDIQSLTVEVVTLTKQVSDIPEIINDTFRRSGIDPANFLKNQESFSLLRKIKRTKSQLETLAVKLVATMAIQFIIFLVIVGFVVSYVNTQTSAVILRDEKYIEKITEKARPGGL